MSRNLYAKRYSHIILGLFSLALIGTFVINLFVDPFWHWQGNQITNVNHGWNERTAKINRFLSKKDNYDCLILGSSRATLLQEKAITSHRCFNLSFSAATAAELLSYTQYVKSKGFIAKKIIIGLDSDNYFNHEPYKNLPRYIKNQQNPPSLISNYLSFDALTFSLKTLYGAYPLYRYYRDDFSSDILKLTPAYEPSWQRRKLKFGEYQPETIHFYQQIINTYPNADTDIYIAPVSVWELQSIKKHNKLTLYIKGQFLAAQLGVNVYDFSVPSAITAKTTNTYDGSHYDKATNLLIAKSIDSGELAFGIKLNQISEDDYFALYLNSRYLQ